MQSVLLKFSMWRKQQKETMKNTLPLTTRTMHFCFTVPPARAFAFSLLILKALTGSWSPASSFIHRSAVKLSAGRSHTTSQPGTRKATKFRAPPFSPGQEIIHRTVGWRNTAEHGCSLSLVLEREVLAATQRNLGGPGGPSSRGGVPQSWTLVGRLANGLGYFRLEDALRKVRSVSTDSFTSPCFLCNV